MSEDVEELLRFIEPKMHDMRLVNGRPCLPCPNPDCDPEGGCCLCEHTGWIDCSQHIAA